MSASADHANAASAPASTPKKTSPKKKATAAKSATHAHKKMASHPTYQAMVKASIINLKESKGSSKAAIFKYILQHYKVGDNVKQVNAHLRAALKRGVTSGQLKQVKGTGASGSFRLGEVAKKVKKAAGGAKKPRKAVAKPKVKKAPSAKKHKSPKKATATAAAASPAAAATTASPAKASPKKAKAAAKPKKVKSPKHKKPKSPKKAKSASPKKAKKAAKPKKVKSPKKATAKATKA